MGRLLVKLFTISFLAVLAAGEGQAVLKGGQLSPGKGFGKVIAAAPPGAERPVSTRLDPWLRKLARDRESPLRLQAFTDSENPLIRLEREENGRIRVPVFIRTTDAVETAVALGSLSGTLRSRAGDVMVASVPLDQLEPLAESPGVVSVEASYFSKPLLDVSRGEIKADSVHSGSGLSSAYKGQGVVVGVVDSGIDLAHPDFSTSSGTRVLSVWDISGVAAGGAARTCTPAQINSGSCSQRDLNGHGTHVAGAAAGNGRALTGFQGIAPESQIIFAKGVRSTTSEGGFSDDDVVAACSYIFSQAGSKPAVINLSLGGHFGAHDGTSNYERSLSNLTGPGRIIVAAAGNEGDELIHVSYGASGTGLSQATESEWRLPQGRVPLAGIDIWYPANGTIYFGIAVYDLLGRYVANTDPIGPGGYKAETTQFGDYEIDAQTVSDPNNGKRRVTVAIGDKDGTINLGNYIYTLYSYGSGTFDAWALQSSFTNYSAQFFEPGNSLKTIGIPATAQKVIAAGAYTTKTQWTDVYGQSQTKTECGTFGEIACFSSRGPTADGRTKPEISAPGNLIASTLSADAIPNQSPSRIMPGSRYLLLEGTSMASPHVTGVVALMLQANPTLTYEQVLAALQNTARKDAYTGSTPNTTFGAGKVDALAAVKSVAGGGGPGPGGPCTPSSTRLCFGDVAVTVTWRSQYTGQTGQATALPQTSEFGYFYFSSPTNPEVFVKVLDWGSQAPYLIFWAGLTDFEFTVTYQNTKTGQIVTKKKDPGSFCGGGDNTSLNH